jgi:iron(III) transport system substrate-binding protein
MPANCRLLLIISVFVALTPLTSCRPAATQEVVIYTSVDQLYSEPVLKQFEVESGIKVLPVYDVEAAKTTGLVNRLIAEKIRPQADVFWSGEFAQTMRLKEEGILSAYRSANTADIPHQYLDPENYWTGFACRARVLLVNTNLVSPQVYPRSLFDFLEPAYNTGQAAIAYPLFGTMATHAAAIYALLGEGKGKQFFQALKQRGIRVVDGNSVVRDMVASGQVGVGLIDTDDAFGAIRDKAPVAAVFPDQDSIGTFIIPNTVALVRGAPHIDNGKKLIDFLLSPRVEDLLIESGWSHIVLRPSKAKPQLLDTSGVKGMDITLGDIYGQLDTVNKDMPEIFIR